MVRYDPAGIADGEPQEMIKLSRITDYGIVLMAHFGAIGPGSTRNAREAAAETRLPLPVVSKILKSLAREGLLASHRGSKGGYSLSRRPEEITVTEMITALEGPIGLTRCTLDSGGCVQEANCHVREPWQRINQAVREALVKITLADLVGPTLPDTLLQFRGLDGDAAGAVEP